MGCPSRPQKGVLGCVDELCSLSPYVVVGLEVSCIRLDESLCRHITHALAWHDCDSSCQRFNVPTKGSAQVAKAAILHEKPVTPSLRRHISHQLEQCILQGQLQDEPEYRKHWVLTGAAAWPQHQILSADGGKAKVSAHLRTGLVLCLSQVVGCAGVAFITHEHAFV